MSDAVVLEPQSPFRDQTPIATTNRNINNIYWRKGEHDTDPGWIIVGPGLETGQAKRWMNRGREPLVVFSYTDKVSPKTQRRETIEYNENNLARERFYWFFKNGGAGEFPVEQVVAYHWHVKPPYGMSAEVFPQLLNFDIPEPLWCALCPPSAPNKNSEAELVQHAIITHQIPVKEAHALIEQSRTPPQGKGIAPKLTRKTAEAATEETGYNCLECGKQNFKTRIGLAGHMRSHA